MNEQTTHSGNEVKTLLDLLRKDFFRRKKELNAVAQEKGRAITYDLCIQDPGPLLPIPTFAEGVDRDLTPMLRARFEHSGEWLNGIDLWLDIPNMRRWVTDPIVRKVHNSLRDYCEDSAPMRNSDDCLSLYGVTIGVPQNIVYLVWERTKTEPSIWTCDQMEIDEFADLVEYLNWKLTGP